MANKYKLNGTVTADVYVEVIADSMEEAIEYAEDNFRIEEYANGMIGVEDDNYEYEGEVVCCDTITWYEEYSECEEEDVEVDD